MDRAPYGHVFCHTLEPDERRVWEDETRGILVRYIKVINGERYWIDDTPFLTSRGEVALLLGGENTEFPPPQSKVVYFHFDIDGAVLYVGQSSNFVRRQIQHKSNSLWWGEVERIEYEFVPSAFNIFEYEKFAIEQLSPKYNVVHNRAGVGK